MPYWNTPKSAATNLDSNTLLSKGSQRPVEFYEIEPAIVLDVIIDKNHPYFNDPASPSHTLNPTQWPTDLKGLPAKPKDLDFTWIGRVLVRLYYSQQMTEKEDLVWAMPLDSGISEYPLLNEVVGVVSYLGRYYYTRRINMFNLPNNDADFSIENAIGGFVAFTNSPVEGNRELILDSNPLAPYQKFQGPISKNSPNGSQGYQGVLGRYFLLNKNIRTLKRHEGDLVIESRFGQSIKFGAYDDHRENDVGMNSDFPGYQDYKGDGTAYTINGKSYKQGGGNPMILIRNRQRPLAEEGKPSKPYENLPAAVGTVEEKNVGGYMEEDINNDGSSFYMTSGVTVSKFKTNCLKKLWGTGEEQSAFQLSGATPFIFPKLIGDQIVINSDRVVISAKKAEMFQYAKKRMAFVTDDEFTIDAHNQIVINTNNKTVLNSPAIYLGEYNQTNEPVLLGQTTINWLFDLCNWILAHTHWYTHTHPDAQGGTVGQPNPNQTQTTVQAQALITLRDTLNKLASRRVFVVGGGFAPGFNGVNIPGLASPVEIGVSTGNGVPGGFSATNRKYSASSIGTSTTSNPTGPTTTDNNIPSFTPPAPPAPTQTQLSNEAANEASAAAAVAKTDRARSAASHARQAAKAAANFESASTTHLINAQTLEEQAKDETNPLIQAQLLTKAQKEKVLSDQFKDKATHATTKAQNYDKIALEEVAKKQGK